MWPNIHNAASRTDYYPASRDSSIFLALPDFKTKRTRYESVNYGISNYWSIVIKSTPRLTKYPSLVLIRLAFIEIQRFKNVKVNKEMNGHTDAVFGQRPDSFLCKFWHILLTTGSIYTKLYRLVPSPSRFEILHPQIWQFPNWPITMEVLRHMTNFKSCPGRSGTIEQTKRKFRLLWPSLPILFKHLLFFL